MYTHTLPEMQSANEPATQYVYFFGAGKADGNGKMKDELGGKGAGLAEMTNAGLPVPPGFTIQTDACREHMRSGGKLSPEVDRQMREALDRLQQLQKQKLGVGENPLLVSVRSGAKFSMPGMMDTILNLGLNDHSVEALAKRSNNPRFAADSYRRLIQMFGNVVLDIPKHAFDEVFDAKKKRRHAKLDTDLDTAALREIIEAYKKVVKKHTGRDFPQDPQEQLVLARDAVFRSWNNERAKTYRRIYSIPDHLGTAVSVARSAPFHQCTRKRFCGEGASASMPARVSTTRGEIRVGSASSENVGSTIFASRKRSTVRSYTLRSTSSLSRPKRAIA